MKLGELRGAIRKIKGNPHVVVNGLRLDVMKTPLLAALEAQFPGGKAVETDIGFNEATGEMVLPAPTNNGIVNVFDPAALDEVLSSEAGEQIIRSAMAYERAPKASLLDLDDAPAETPAPKPRSILDL